MAYFIFKLKGRTHMNCSGLVGVLVLFTILSSVFSPGRVTAQTTLLAYKNPALPIDQRVNDLISHMSLEEKVGQMMNDAPAIERLGIPQYEWWNEGLHGVARAGYATVFPQAIGLAATWDTDLMSRVADVISTEARAKNNEFVRNNERGRYKGLTFWSPNINIFRDPRWGRGQETYGEDPYLTARLGVEFVKGLQGNDPKYLKVVATPKHFAVHSGPEPERHSFDAKIYERDLRETYLPAFRATVMEAQAASVMCAYNRTDGLPCCASSDLLTDILRREWNFGGYIVSDCGAITDIWKGHKFAPTEEGASAVAVKAGTDLACGHEYASLVKAVKDGLINEAEIDVALKRLLVARFRLGMFDPPEMVKYTQIPFTENDSPPHRALSRQAARESMILLKNENNALPLKKNLKTIAVIGPNADAPEVLVGNYSGRPSSSVTPLAGIKNAVSPGTKVLYAQGSTLTGEWVVPVPPAFLTVAGKGTTAGLKGEYFANQELQGGPADVRTDAQVNFDWGRYKPSPHVSENNFSARWTGKLTPSESGPYHLGVTSDDGARLYLDGQLLVDTWRSNPTKTVTKEVSLEAGHSYDIRVEYFQYNREAIAKLVWSYPNFAQRQINEAVNAARQSDVAVVVLGLSAALEGEEMTVNTEGFLSGDRTDIALPKGQEALLKAVQATGKPVVLVLLNGSALAVNWANANVPAIVDAWYPGEEGGSALADVLFGDYNPGGRLPVTFYKSVDQLPPFEDYNMEGRTYRYFRGEPLYPFGFGLSYTKFAYSNLKFSQKINGGEDLVISADVQNVGGLAGGEVVQLYVKDLSASVPVPIRSLAGIARLNLKPGEKRNLSFTLNPRQMSVILDNGKRVIEPGDFEISIGGKQPGFSGSGDAKATNVVSGKFTVFGKILEIPER
jgi:beta-glucosidase